LNIHGVNYDKQTEIHTADQLVPEPSAFEGEERLIQGFGRETCGKETTWETQA